MLIASSVGAFITAGVDFISSMSFFFTKTPPIVQFFNHTLFIFKVESISWLPKILGIGKSGQQSLVIVSFGQMFTLIFLIMFLISVIWSIRNAGKLSYQETLRVRNKARNKENSQDASNTRTISNVRKQPIDSTERRSR
jgi:hypothetical protein